MTWLTQAKPLEAVSDFELREFSREEISEILNVILADGTAKKVRELECQYQCYSESFAYSMYDQLPRLTDPIKLLVDLDASPAELSSALVFTHTLARLHYNVWLSAIASNETPPIKSLQVFNGMPVSRGFLYGPITYLREAFRLWVSDMHCIVGIEPFSYLINPTQSDTSMHVWTELRELYAKELLRNSELQLILDEYTELRLPVKELSPAAYLAWSNGKSSTENIL